MDSLSPDDLCLSPSMNSASEFTLPADLSIFLPTYLRPGLVDHPFILYQYYVSLFVSSRHYYYYRRLPPVARYSAIHYLYTIYPPGVIIHLICYTDLSFDSLHFFGPGGSGGVKRGEGGTGGHGACRRRKGNFFFVIYEKKTWG
ncbi:hypothetical protein F5X99DRAFT_300225 [Biscogniauxia marginata]|nr:hypothetical protein F5X99DRAFT_300225 [Biscogniauxia marginata]